MRVASQNNVKPARLGTKEFEAMANEGTIKWAMNPKGEIWAVPHTVNGYEISHAVIFNGRAVKAAGQADIAYSAGRGYGISINPHSGHYMYGSSSSTNFRVMQMAREGFSKHGVQFPK
jgi:hypothetical protein